jgi:hypothetical protein
VPTKMFCGGGDSNRVTGMGFICFSSNSGLFSEFGDEAKLDSSHILVSVLNVANP